MSSSTWTVADRTSRMLGRLSDYWVLSKPKIAILMLITVAVATYVAQSGRPDPAVLGNTLIGMFLVAGSASALNQWFERKRDALMARTANRPLPDGRLQATEVAVMSSVAVAIGTAYLWTMVNWQTAAVALASWFLYVWVYTPLKSRTWHNTAVGAVAGALPVLMGWTATGGSLNPATDPRAAAMFAVLLLWQFPHFMAIAWIYRDQYARAGLKMLTVVDPSGRLAGIHAVLNAVLLIPASVLLFAAGSTTVGTVLLAILAFTLGVGQLFCAIRFKRQRNEGAARALLRASLIYLPAILTLLVILPLC